MGIKHIGNPVSPACGVRGDVNTVNGGLGLERYKRLGKYERFKDEPPYRICKRCLAVERKR